MQYVLATLGALFWTAAFLLIKAGLELEIVVAVEASPFLEGFDGVANLQLMHVQAQHLTLGVGAAICGSIFICAALISSGLRPPANPDE